MRVLIHTAVLAGALTAVAGTAEAFGPRVIFSEVVSSPTSDAPGLPGRKITGFDRPFRSASGNYWILSATIDTGAATTDEILIVGSGLSSLGSQTVVQEGVTDIGGGRLIDSASIDTQLQINDQGVFAFTGNLSGATTDDEVIIKGDVNNLGLFSLIAQEGQSSGIGATTFGAIMANPNVNNAGQFAWRSTLTGAATGQTNALFITDGTPLAQSGVTQPAGQLLDGTRAWNTFASFEVADNNDWMARGTLTAPTSSDSIAVVNGTVVAQEGAPLPGVSPTTPNVLSIVEDRMMPGGDWLLRGSYAGGQDWLMQNGNLIAQTGDTVPGGLPGETLSDVPFAATFFAMVGDDNGNYVYGSTTSNPDVDRDAVLIYNNAFVVARQFDPVDLNGDGVFNDDMFINVFNNDDMFLSNDGYLFFTADVVNSSGAALGQAYMVIQVPAPGAAGLLALAGVAGLRRRRA